MKNLTVEISHKYKSKSFKRKRFLVKGSTFAFCNVKVLERIMGPGKED
jgi:hypothetical protein